MNADDRPKAAAEHALANVRVGTDTTPRTSISKRELRAATLYRLLTGLHTDVDRLSLVYELPELHGWVHVEKWIAVLDLAKQGVIRTRPLGASDIAIEVVNAEPAAAA